MIENSSKSICTKISVPPCSGGSLCYIQLRKNLLVRLHGVSELTRDTNNSILMSKSKKTSLFAVCMYQTLNMSQEKPISPLNIKDELGGSGSLPTQKQDAEQNSSHSTIIFVAADCVYSLTRLV